MNAKGGEAVQVTPITIFIISVGSFAVGAIIGALLVKMKPGGDH